MKPPAYGGKPGGVTTNPNGTSSYRFNDSGMAPQRPMPNLNSGQMGNPYAGQQHQSELARGGPEMAQRAQMADQRLAQNQAMGQSAPMAPVPMSSSPPAAAGYRLPGNFNDLPPQQQFEISNESALSRISPGARQQYDSLRASARPQWRDEMAMMEDQSIPFQERLARRREMSKGMSLGNLEARRSLGTALFDAKHPQYAGNSAPGGSGRSLKERSPELYEYMRMTGKLRSDQLEGGDTPGYKSPYADRPNEDGGAMHAGIASRRWSTRGHDGRRAIDVDYTPDYLAQLTRKGGGSGRR